MRLRKDQYTKEGEASERAECAEGTQEGELKGTVKYWSHCHALVWNAKGRWNTSQLWWQRTENQRRWWRLVINKLKRNKEGWCVHHGPQRESVARGWAHAVHNHMRGLLGAEQSAATATQWGTIVPQYPSHTDRRNAGRPTVPLLPLTPLPEQIFKAGLLYRLTELKRILRLSTLSRSPTPQPDTPVCSHCFPKCVLVVITPTAIPPKDIHLSGLQTPQSPPWISRPAPAPFPRCSGFQPFQTPLLLTLLLRPRFPVSCLSFRQPLLSSTQKPIQETCMFILTNVTAINLIF